MTPEQTKRSGQCLCGAVKYQATLLEEGVHVCHCTLCQKWHGGPGMAAGCDGDWSIQGEENLTWYASSDWAKRGFCKTCGSHLLFKTNDASYHGIAAGTLDNLDGFKIESHIFVDKKPSYYDFNDNAPRLTEEEFLKMVGEHTS